MGGRKKCDLDLTFDLAVVTLNYKILSGLYLGNCKVYVGSWYLVGTLVGGVCVQRYGETLI